MKTVILNPVEIGGCDTEENIVCATARRFEYKDLSDFLKATNRLSVFPQHDSLLRSNVGNLNDYFSPVGEKSLETKDFPSPIGNFRVLTKDWNFLDLCYETEEGYCRYHWYTTA